MLSNLYLLRSLATKPNLLFPFSSKSSTVSQNRSPIFCPVINYKLRGYSESIKEKKRLPPQHQCKKKKKWTTNLQGKC